MESPVTEWVFPNEDPLSMKRFGGKVKEDDSWQPVSTADCEWRLENKMLHDLALHHEVYRAARDAYPIRRFACPVGVHSGGPGLSRARRIIQGPGTNDSDHRFEWLQVAINHPGGVLAQF